MRAHAPVLAVMMCLSVSARPADDPLNARIFAYDKKLPIDLRQQAAETLDGYTRAALTYRSPMEGRVPADLFAPTDASSARKSPAIIVLHGLPGSRSSIAPLAASYARAGVVALCLDAPFNRFDLPYRTEVLIPAPRFDDYDSREMVQVAMDISRAIEVLSADTRVDPARIGFVGFSYGGGIGVLMAAIEPRLRTLALMSPTSGLVTWLFAAPDAHIAKQTFRSLSPSTQARWIETMSPLEPVRWLAGARSPRPFLLQAARRDENISAGDTAKIIKAGRGAATVKWYDSGHILPVEAEIDQAAFLAEALRFDRSRFAPPTSRVR